MKLLHIDSSILGAASASRALSAETVATLVARHPGIEVTSRDLAAAPLQHLSGLHLAADPSTDAAEGATALAEFLAADLVVIGAPMYNFSIPSQLKSWIDRITVAGTTFRYTEKGFEGLVLGKKFYIVSTRGGSYQQPPLEALDHQESYLKAVFGFLGVTDLTFIRAEGLAREQLREQSLADAKGQVAALAAA